MSTTGSRKRPCQRSWFQRALAFVGSIGELLGQQDYTKLMEVQNNRIMQLTREEVQQVQREPRSRKYKGQKELIRPGLSTVVKRGIYKY